MPFALRPFIARFASLSALLAVVSVAAGCSSDPVAATGDKFPTDESFCTARAEKECAVSDLCTIKKDACLTKRKDLCTASTFASGKLGLTYSPANADACITQLSASYTEGKTLIKAEELRQIDTACLKVFVGKIEKNKACENTQQCVGSLICDKGFCADLVRKPADSPCVGPGDACVAGYTCIASSGTELKTCVKRKAKDELCVGVDTCEEGLLCNGTCKAKLAIGELCNTSADCASTLCDTNVKKCAVGLTFASGADACKGYGG